MQHRDRLAYKCIDRALRLSLRITPPSRLANGLALWWGHRFQASPTVIRSRSGSLLAVDPSDYLQLLLYYTGTFEPHCIRIVRRCLKPGDVFWDVGANIGFFSMETSRLVGAGGRVISIEPAPPNVKCLRENCVRNGCSNVSVVETAVGLGFGTATLRRPCDGNYGMFTLGRTEACESYDVQIQTLDNIAQQYETQRIDVIKMDIEGSELAALSGARETLERFRPTLLIELNEAALRACGSSCRDVKHFLAVAGYCGWCIRGRSLVAISQDQHHECDECLFIHESRRDHRRRCGLA